MIWSFPAANIRLLPSSRISLFAAVAEETSRILDIQVNACTAWPQETDGDGCDKRNGCVLPPWDRLVNSNEVSRSCTPGCQEELAEVLGETLCRPRRSLGDVLPSCCMHAACNGDDVHGLQQLLLLGTANVACVGGLLPSMVPLLITAPSPPSPTTSPVLCCTACTRVGLFVTPPLPDISEVFFEPL